MRLQTDWVFPRCWRNKEVSDWYLSTLSLTLWRSHVWQGQCPSTWGRSHTALASVEIWGPLCPASGASHLAAGASDNPP